MCYKSFACHQRLSAQRLILPSTNHPPPNPNHSYCQMTVRCRRGLPQHKLNGATMEFVGQRGLSHQRAPSILRLCLCPKVQRHQGKYHRAETTVHHCNKRLHLLRPKKIQPLLGGKVPRELAFHLRLTPRQCTSHLCRSRMNWCHQWDQQSIASRWQDASDCRGFLLKASHRLAVD